MVTVKLTFRDFLVRIFLDKDSILISRKLNENGSLFLVQIQESGRLFIFFLLLVP